jgi:hypothetical protein
MVHLLRCSEKIDLQPLISQWTTTRPQRTICAWEKGFSILGQGVQSMRFARPRPQPYLLDQTVALKACEVRANRIVSQIQCLCKLIHNATLCPKQGENSASSAVQETLPPSKGGHFKRSVIRPNQSTAIVTHSVITISYKLPCSLC